MALTKEQKNGIRSLLETKIKNKLARYARESTSMPFLTRLIQDNEKVAAYSFIHSMATTLGMSIYEEVSVIIAEGTCSKAEKGHEVEGNISSSRKSIIDKIIRELRNGERKSCWTDEVSEVLNAPNNNISRQSEGRIADFFMIKNNQEYYFEIKTVKPNIDIFTKSKAKLLEWVARRDKEINCFLAFPYNPYYPQPYQRFTVQGVMEPGSDFLVGEEYWDYIGGKGTYKDLLVIFDEVGFSLRSEISEKIRKVAKNFK